MKKSDGPLSTSPYRNCLPSARVHCRILVFFVKIVISRLERASHFALVFPNDSLTVNSCPLSTSRLRVAEARREGTPSDFGGLRPRTHRTAGKGVIVCKKPVRGVARSIRGERIDRLNAAHRRLPGIS